MKRSAPRSVSGRLARFAAVGVGSTVAYAAFAWALTAFAAAPPVAASAAAYAMAALLSYLGHKRITFRSDQTHAHDAPRFVAGSAAGLLLATALPLICTERLHWPRMAAVVLTCVAAPVVNFLVLDTLVFGRPPRGAGSPP